MMRYSGSHNRKLITAAGVLVLAAAAFKLFKRGAKAGLTQPETLTDDPSYEPIRSGRDQVDEASWESFPASDPPARY